MTVRPYQDAAKHRLVAMTIAAGASGSCHIGGVSRMLAIASSLRTTRASETTNGSAYNDAPHPHRSEAVRLTMRGRDQKP